MPTTDWPLTLATIFLAVITAILAGATFWMAYQTRALVRLNTLIEETRLSIEQNWMLWRYRKQLFIPVAPQSLSEDDWRWRVSLLNHFNLLLLAYRRCIFGIDKHMSQDILNGWVEKARRVTSNARQNPIGKEQLKLLLHSSEGFPKDFIDWMRKNGIITGDDI